MSKTLDELIEKNRVVYVNCTAGQSRSTTLSAFYLCLFMKAQNWKTPEEVVKEVKRNHSGATPNVPAILLGLERYKQFQLDLLERLRRLNDEEEDRRRLAREEELRLQRLRELEKAKREAELAAERERARKLEEERMRLRKLEEEKMKKRRVLEEQERQRLIGIGNDRDA